MAEMTARERAIREERAQTYDKMVAVMEKLDNGERLTVEDRKAFDDAEARLEELDGDLDRVMKVQEREKGRDENAETRGVSRDEHDSDEAAYTRAYVDWFKNGEQGMTTESRAILRGETRAQLDSASMQTLPGQGGYMIPQGFWNNLQIAMKQYGGLLSLCNVIQTGTGNEMPWPTNNPTGVLGQYITEANQVPFTDYVFGQGILYAWTITSGVVLASFQLINDSVFNVDSFITDRMGEAIGRKVAAELWAGAGSGSKALTGLTTAIAAQNGSGSGMLSSPGFVQAAAAESVPTLAAPSGSATKAKQLVSWNSFTLMIASVDSAYRAGGRCCFVMNDAQVQRERTLTDTQGHPLWQPNTQAGQQDTILGYPVHVDNNAPDVSTTANAVGGVVFGDLKTAMVVRQVNNAGSMRLTERYADFLQVGYLSYVRMDSQPNDLRAVVSYQTGAS